MICMLIFIECASNTSEKDIMGTASHCFRVLTATLRTCMDNTVRHKQACCMRHDYTCTAHG